MINHIQDFFRWYRNRDIKPASDLSWKQIEKHAIKHPECYAQLVKTKYFKDKKKKSPSKVSQLRIQSAR